MRKYLITIVVLFLASPLFAAVQEVPSGAGVFWPSSKAVIDSNDTALQGQLATKWESGRTYTADNNLVVHDGYIYICTANHTAGSTTEPGTGAGWDTVWSFNGIFSQAYIDAIAANSAKDTFPGFDTLANDYGFDPTGKQDRVTGTCPEGSSIRVINSDGTVTCETDDNSGTGSTELDALTDVTGDGTTDYILYDDGDGTYSFRAAPSGSVTVDTTLQDGSTNPVTNNAIYDGLVLKQDDLDVPGQAEAEAGTATLERVWTAQRIAQAIAALAPSAEVTTSNLQSLIEALSSLDFSGVELTVDDDFTFTEDWDTTAEINAATTDADFITDAEFIVSDDCSGETPTLGVICFEY